MQNRDTEKNHLSVWIVSNKQKKISVTIRIIGLRQIARIKMFFNQHPT